MNKSKSLFITACWGVVFLLSGCASSESFVGLSREEIVKRIEAYPRFPVFDQYKVMICCKSTFRYYDAADDILQDKKVMNCDEWDIAFEETFWGKKYIRIFFKDNLVEKQQAGYLNDGP